MRGLCKVFTIFFVFRADIIEYNKLSKNNPNYNLNNAFNVAEEKLGLTRLLDAEGKFVNKYMCILLMLI